MVMVMSEKPTTAKDIFVELRNLCSLAESGWPETCSSLLIPDGDFPPQSWIVDLTLVSVQ